MKIQQCPALCGSKADAIIVKWRKSNIIKHQMVANGQFLNSYAHIDYINPIWVQNSAVSFPYPILS